MKLTVALVLAVAALAHAESDNTMEIALSFVKDCQGDYALCVKVHNFLKLSESV